MTGSGTGSRLLMILRHAKSAWNTDAETDHDRPLAPRGKRSSKLIGQYIQHHAILPDYVLSSSARRVIETGNRVLRAATNKSPIDIAWQQLQDLYACGREDWLTFIQEIPDDVVRLMVIGHNPELAELVSALPAQAPPLPDNGKLMPTAALALFRIVGPWASLNLGQATLIDVIRPRTLENIQQANESHGR